MREIYFEYTKWGKIMVVFFSPCTWRSGKYNLKRDILFYSHYFFIINIILKVLFIIISNKLISSSNTSNIK